MRRVAGASLVLVLAGYVGGAAAPAVVVVSTPIPFALRAPGNTFVYPLSVVSI